MPKIYNDKDLELYDRYNRLNKYNKMLVIPERNAQSAEFNELQSMILDMLKRLGDTLFKDGNVVTGCGINVKNNKVVIEPGKIYFDGIVHSTSGGEVTITSIGQELIGVKIDETIVTEADDESLLDPATGHANYLHPGAYRVKQDLVFTVNDESAAILVALQNGEIVNLTSERPQADSISEILARRTYDESGNYVANGFEILDSKYATSDKIYLGLSAGKAYVRGYEVGKPLDITFEINRCKATNDIIGEVNLVSTSANRYKLNFNPVKEVTRVFVTALQSDTITRGSIPNTSDTLSRTSIQSIQSIKQNTTTYLPGKDFTLVGNKIDWSLNGAEPEGGTNYTVAYRYKTNLSPNQYSVEEDKDGFTYISLQSGSVVANTEFYVDYTYYISRKDSIGIDKYGNVKVFEGTPSDIGSVVAPVITDSSILLLGSVCALPNSDKCIIINNTTRVTKMSKIQSTIKRVEDLEYNQAITDLDKEAMDGEPIATMRGIFTDGFLNFNKIDQLIEGVKLALDVQSGILTLPYNEFLAQLTPSNEATNNYTTMGNVYTCKYSEVLEFEQPFRTRMMLVNPYQVFDPIISIKIDPSVDTWVNTSYINVDKEFTTKVNLVTWWNHAKNNWSGNEQKLWEDLGMTGKVPDNMNWGSITSNRWGSIWGWNGTNYTMTGTGTNVALDQATMYMRKRTVKVTCSTFESFENNIQLSFDGRICPLTPINGTIVGSTPGSLKANNKGHVEGTFEIPDNVPCGTKEVKLFSPKYQGITSYSANGRDVVIENLVYKINYQTQVWDPLAQTFQLDNTCNLTSVDIFVALKDGDIPLTVQIRNTTNGYPNNEILGEKVILADDLRVSEDASVATKVTFDNVIKIEKDTQYAIVILTDSPKIKVHVACLGEKDDVSGKYVISNPYTAGILFSSSNALAWTPHQDMDLKFRLYRANYESDGMLRFLTVNSTKADRVMMALEHIQPSGTSIQFEMSVNSGEWTPCYPWLDKFFNENVSNVDIRVIFKSNGYQSPLILKDTSLLAYWYNELDCCYVTKNLEVPEGFNKIKFYLDTAKIAGTNYKVFYATDSTGDIWTEITEHTGNPISDVWEEREYSHNVTSTAHDLRVKVVMTTENTWDSPAVRRLRVITKHE